MKLFPSKPANNLVSIVIPAYKEAGNVARYKDELMPALEKLKYDYELIITEDGSTDKGDDSTWDELLKLQKDFPNKITVVRHARNYGMTSALQTGFEHANGDYIILFSADLETSPKDIQKVIDKLDEGYDFVNTVRGERWTESGFNVFVRKLPSMFANMLIERSLGLKTKDNGSGLKGYKRFIIDNMPMYGEMQRLMVSYTGMYTKKTIEIPVDYHEREFGQSAYGGFKNMFKRTYAVITDLIGLRFMATFATKPFNMMPSRAFGTTAFIMIGFGILLVLLNGILPAFSKGITLNNPLFAAGLVIIALGVQVFIVAMLGELLLRIYFQSGKVKNFVVAEKILASHDRQSRK